MNEAVAWIEQDYDDDLRLEPTWHRLEPDGLFFFFCANGAPVGPYDRGPEAIRPIFEILPDHQCDPFDRDSPCTWGGLLWST